MTDIENVDTQTSATDTQQASASSDTGATTGASTQATSESSIQSPSASTATEALTATPGAESGTSQEAPLATEHSEAITPEAFAQLKKQYAGSTKSWQQERQRAQELEQRLQQLEQQYKPFHGIDQAKLQDFQKTQGVPRWESTHPEHAEFRQLRKTYEGFDRLIRNATDPATKDYLLAQMDKQISQDELHELGRWQKDVQRQEWERQNNPQEFYRKLIQAEAKPVIQNHLQTVSQTYQDTEAAKQQAASWMKDNPVATAENIQSVMKLMEGGMKFEQATLQIERDHWKSQIHKANDAKSSAEEKERLLQGRVASVGVRNPQTDKRIDFVKYKTEKNLNGRAAIDALFELDAAKKL